MACSHADYAEEYSKAVLFRRERQFGVEVLCFGVCLRKSARSAGDLLGFRLCKYRLSTLACYSPADGADHAEECSKLHYFAEKDRLDWLRKCRN